MHTSRAVCAKAWLFQCLASSTQALCPKLCMCVLSVKTKGCPFISLLLAQPERLGITWLLHGSSPCCLCFSMVVVRTHLIVAMNTQAWFCVRAYAYMHKRLNHACTYMHTSAQSCLHVYAHICTIMRTRLCIHVRDHAHASMHT